MNHRHCKTLRTRNNGWYHISGFQLVISGIFTFDLSYLHVTRTFTCLFTLELLWSRCAGLDLLCFINSLRSVFQHKFLSELCLPDDHCAFKSTSGIKYFIELCHISINLMIEYLHVYSISVIYSLHLFLIIICDFQVLFYHCKLKMSPMCLPPLTFWI